MTATPRPPLTESVGAVVVSAEVFYSSPQTTLWLGDSRHVLAETQTESVDLILTDPPYGVSFQSGMRQEKFAVLHNDDGSEQSGEVIEQILRECVRVVGQNRHIYVFGPEVLAAGDMKVSAPAELVWKKLDGPGMGDLSSPWGRSHESINFYTSKHRHAGQRGKENTLTRMRKGTVLAFNRPSGLTVRHPTEKPVALLSELIESSSQTGELVLDPFGGVGSTAVAAILRGRRAVVCELKEEFCAIARDRIIAAERLAGEMARA